MRTEIEIIKGNCLQTNYAKYLPNSYFLLYFLLLVTLNHLFPKKKIRQKILPSKF